jgi:hypothetical protein
MLLILVGLFIWTLALVGLGLLARFWLGRPLADLGDLPIAFWIGWALSILLLQLVNFVLPIRPWGALLVLALGCLGLALHRGEVFALCARARRPPVVVLLVIAAFAAFIALRSAMPLIEGDSGEYHLASVAWSSSHAIVRGLGNLMPRLAFNQSFFLYAAMLDIGPFLGNSYQLANGILLLSVVTLGVLSLRRLFSAPREESPRLLFYALMLAPALHQMNDERFFSLSPDTAPFLLGIVVMGELLGSLFREEHPTHARDVAAITLLCVVGVACKQSFLVFALGATTIVWVAWLREGFRAERAGAWRSVMPALIITLLVGGAWVARGLLLSGYPFFPAAVLPLPLEWRVPSSIARAELEWIVTRARNPGIAPDQIVPGAAWLAGWLRSLPNSIVKPAELSAALLLFSLVLWPGRSGSQRGAGRLLALAVVPLLSIAYWLLTAPSPRFAGSAFWTLLALLILAFGYLLGLHNGEHGPTVLIGIALIFFMWVAPLAPWKLALSARTLLDARREAHVPSYTSQLTQSGLAVNVPTSEDECWDTPLPCTTHFSDHLALLEPGHLAGGFRMLPEAAP